MTAIGPFRGALLPGGLDQVLLGLRLALDVGWPALVIGEQINATSGIGYILWTAPANVDTAGAIASLTTYALLGRLTDLVVRALESRLLSRRNGFEG